MPIDYDSLEALVLPTIRRSLQDQMCAKFAGIHETHVFLLTKAGAHSLRQLSFVYRWFPHRPVLPAPQAFNTALQQN